MGERRFFRIPALAREIINSGETISALSGVKG
jgi:hypothetical protein